MRILGVDPGSVATGFGIIDQVRGALTLVDHGCISASRSDELPARLLTIYQRLSELIASTRPEVVAIESSFHGLNAKSLIRLSHARGVILLAAVNAGLPVFEYSPRRLTQPLGHCHVYERDLTPLTVPARRMCTPPQGCD